MIRLPRHPKPLRASDAEDTNIVCSREDSVDTLVLLSVTGRTVERKSLKWKDMLSLARLKDTWMILDQRREGRSGSL